MKIAIVGFALSGFYFLKEILDTKNDNNLTIDIYEKRSEYSVGLPYENDSLVKLLNVDSTEMIYPPIKRNDFPKWMEENGKELDPEEKMAPRVYFGEYLKDIAKAYLKDPSINIINEEATEINVSLSEGEESYQIVSENHSNNYDLVFLATGATCYNDPYKLNGEENYIENPYPLEEKLKNIPYDKSIAILGTSASSTDVFRYLNEKKNIDKTINFFTGENEYKIVDIPYEGNIYDYYTPNQEWIDDKLRADSRIKLDCLLDTVRDDFKKAGYELEYAYNTYKDHTLDLSRKAIRENDQALAFTEDYFIQFTLYIADLVNFMNPIDRKKYMDECYQYLAFLGGKTPHNSMKLLLDAYDKDKIDIITNSESVSKNDDGSFTLIGDKEKSADIVINCTGFDLDLDSLANKIPLYESLYKNEMIMADEDNKGIAVTWPRCNPLSKKHGYLKNLFITGMIITNTDLDNNDARCIQKTASRIARIVIEDNNL
ncbi:FAD/NAD(P)-binding protein [Anaerococcus vaginimassiliensis]|uniref:FAD/NAD(P)-binding protein n=1 Tax=Anaerococcus vaginimassiliensis TaxID=2042308 RepID=UPI00103113A2|nr:FAD/NAD(P)-binding protein [Anaerococcus vaginimassiliensis]